MATSTRVAPKQGGGLVVFDGTFSADLLDEAQLTQEGLAAGVTVPTNPEVVQAVPEVFGAQTVGIQSSIVRGGPPSSDPMFGACQTAVRADGSSGWQGWNHGAVIEGIAGVPDFSWSGQISAVTNPDTGACYVIARAGTVGDAQVWSWDIHANTVTITGQPGTLDASQVGVAHWWGGDNEIRGVGDDGVCIAFSLDTGESKVVGFITGTMGTRTQAVRSRVDGQVLVISYDTDGSANDIFIHGSYDNGATWESLSAEAYDIGLLAPRMQLASLQSGGFLALYSQGAGDLFSRKLGTCTSSFTGSVESKVSDSFGAAEGLAAVTDESGVVYLHATAYPTSFSGVKVYSSLDGVSWNKEIWSLTAAKNGGSLVPIAAGYGGGAIGLLCKPETSGTIRNQLIAVRCGGWSELSLQTNYITNASGYSRIGIPASWGGVYGASYPNEMWLPHTLPDSDGWTKVNTAGVAALSTSGAPALIITTTPGEQLYYEENLAKSNGQVSVMYQARVVGGETTLNFPYSGIKVRAENVAGTAGFQIKVSFTSAGTIGFDGFTSVDPFLTFGPPASGKPMWVFVVIDAEQSKGWVYAKTAIDDAWELVIDGELLTDVGTNGGNHTVTFGNITTAISTTTTYVNMCAIHADRLDGWGSASDGDWDWANTQHARRFGAPMGKRFCPLLGDAAGLLVRTGSAKIGQSFTHPVSYDYPASNAVDVVPRAKKWRSTQKDDDEVFEFTLPKGSQEYGMMALALIGCNFRTAVLEYWDGAAWVELAEADLAEAVGSWGRESSQVWSIEANSTPERRFFHNNEFVGGYFAKVSGLANTVGDAYVIAKQTAGRWDGHHAYEFGLPDPKPPKKNSVWLELDGDVSSMDDHGDNAILVSPNGILLVPGGVKALKWRVVIPGGQSTPYDYYEAAAIRIGYVAAWGADTDWSTQKTTKQSQRITTNRNGRIHSVTKQANTRKQWQIGWNTGVLLHTLRREGDDAVANNDGYAHISAHDDYNAIGIPEDVLWWLEGHIEHNGEHPVVALDFIPDSIETIIDPSMWLYGYMQTGKDLDGTLFAGRENIDEAIRVASITITEVD